MFFCVRVPFLGFALFFPVQPPGAGSYFSVAGEALGFPKGEAAAPTGVAGAVPKPETQ